MTQLNNISRLKDTRKELRNNSTQAEKVLWGHLKGSKFHGYKFRRQHSIGRYIIDFYCPEKKISIELDGKVHENQKEYDAIRSEYLLSCKVKEIRFSNDEIFEDVAGVLKKLDDFIKEGSILIPPPNPLLTKEGEAHEVSGGGIWDFHDEITYKNEAIQGINETVVRQISAENEEPSWMLELRLKALKIFREKKMPSWGPDLSNLDLNSIYYFRRPEGAGNNKSWDDVPENIKKTFDKLGIPEAEKKALAGVGAQYDSETVYHNLKPEIAEKGVIFDDLTHALKNPAYEAIIRQYFSKSIPLADHTFSALHYAVWSGGTFLYIPKGVKISEPLQSYFRMNAKKGGQFEHTLIILEEGAEAHYIEGCSAPKYDENSLHAGGVEVFVGKNATMRYSSVENWSLDTYNLNTKRAIIEESGYMEWVGGNLGSNTTMLYPCSVLKGDNSRADHLGIAFANAGQNQDTGAKVIHIGKNTSSSIVSKSISKGGGLSTYRGLVDIKESALGAVTKIECDALLLDNISGSDTIPDIRVGNTDAIVAHEASAGKINEEDLFYLQSRGIDEEQAAAMIVNGFISPIMKELPLEYASELNVLISMEMEGSIG